MSHLRHQEQPPPPQSAPNGVLLPPPSSSSSSAAAAAAAAAAAIPPPRSDAIAKLASANEETWCLIGAVAESMGALDRALSAYENALRHNANSVHGLSACANILRIKEKYAQAVDYFQRALQIQPENGEVWSSLGHCYLMQDQLQKAYSAYQQALYFLPSPKEDPKLWYGIGILYDRYGSLEHAEEAFVSVLAMDKNFEKANEILFRLGIIYKQQGKYRESLDCFDRILRSPPSPLAHIDIWFQIGHVYEQLKDYDHAKDAYERVVIDAPNHAKVLQQLGWLYHIPQASFQNQDLAVQYLTKSLEADASDAQSWYLLGRAYMAGQKYSKAYEAYQQAVYRDGRNPTFWCSIGVLYFQINQFRDALDAYSRAIRINPYISEVWFDLGSLYESCNNQISDAIDAYERAAELDPTNTHVVQRLQLLKNAQATGAALPAAPVPKDVNPMAYNNPSGPPMPSSGANGANGAPPMLNMPQGATHRGSLFNRSSSRGPGDMLPNPAANGMPGIRTGSPPGPYGGGPSPVALADERRLSHNPHAPISVDRSTHREDTFPPQRALLHDSPRGMPPPPPQRYASERDVRPVSRGGRMSPRSMSPGPPPPRARSPGYPAAYQQSRMQPTQSPRYRYEPAPGSDRGDAVWDRERERRAEVHSSHQRHRAPSRERMGNGRPEMPSRSSTLMSQPGGGGGVPGGGYSRHASPPLPPPVQPPAQYAAYERSPALPAMRDSPHSTHTRSPDQGRRRPSDESPRNGVGYWDPRRDNGAPPQQLRAMERERGLERDAYRSPRQPPVEPLPPQQPPPQQAASRRYDPRLDEAPLPPPSRNMNRMYDQPPPPPPVQMQYTYERGERAPSPRAGEKRRRMEDGPVDVPPQRRGDNNSVVSSVSSGSRRQRRSVGPPGVNGNGNGIQQTPQTKKEPQDVSPRSSIHGSDRATPSSGKRKSPTGPPPTSARTLDEDYDEGVADALIGLASFARPRTSQPQPPPPPPVMQENGLKRPLSPGPDSAGSDAKRLRTDAAMTLPPIATLSPTSPTSTTEEGEEREGPGSGGAAGSKPSPRHSKSPRDRVVASPAS